MCVDRPLKRRECCRLEKVSLTRDFGALHEQRPPAVPRPVPQVKALDTARLDSVAKTRQSREMNFGVNFAKVGTVITLNYSSEWP